ncbi:uncharacterized protein DFL_005235 [Arthrobotrys flagrans]|uniref:Uncharacterized protein n=1 Tax=Arthrobotrys flagrans TaxID=97331 RepID=A0A437A732_ARTFL|nr:hypothetical protein DFL_005235 [Arthrobotrys flagrans]
MHFLLLPLLSLPLLTTAQTNIQFNCAYDTVAACAEKAVTENVGGFGWSGLCGGGPRVEVSTTSVKRGEPTVTTSVEEETSSSTFISRGEPPVSTQTAGGGGGMVVDSTRVVSEPTRTTAGGDAVTSSGSAVAVVSGPGRVWRVVGGVVVLVAGMV